MAVAARPSALPKLGYQPALDGLRALSILGVILYHSDLSWMIGGFLGVEVFFVVSGFLITSLLLEERHHSGAVSMRGFWIRRARRLLPAVYLLLAVVTIASLLVYHDAAGRLGGDVIAALFYVSNWWQIFLEESYFAATGRPPLLQHLWSLAIEEQFYVLFPPLFVAGMARLGRVRTRNIVILVALASAIEMAVLYEPFVDTSRIYFGTDTRAAGLLVGVLLALVWTPWQSRHAAHAHNAGRVLDVVGVLGLLVIVWFMVRVNPYDAFIYRGGFLLFDIVTIVVIGVLVHPASRLSSVLGAAPLVWIGVRSYSLYLWHWPIFQVTRPGLDVPLDGLPLFVLRMLLTFTAAELSFRLVETPVRAGVLGRWWATLRSSQGTRRREFTQRAAGAAGACVVLIALLSWGLHDAASSPEREAIEAAAIAAIPGAELTAGVDEDPSAPVTTQVPPTTVAPVSTTIDEAGGGEGSGAEPVPAEPGVTPTDALAVGDSVMLGAEGPMRTAMPGIRIDAKVARQFDSLLSVAKWYIKEGLAPGPLIVHAGTNGVFQDSDLDELIEAAGDRKVLLVNAKTDAPWEELANSRIAAAAERHDNVTLVDWNSLGHRNPDWFAPDGEHLKPAGARAFAELIRSNL